MTLRFLVVLLFLANALLWVGSHGLPWRADRAPTEVSASDPIARQVRPEALVVRPLAEVAAAAPQTDGREAPADTSAEPVVPGAAPDAVTAADETPADTLALPPQPEEGDGMAKREPAADAVAQAPAAASMDLPPRETMPEPDESAAHAACWQAGPFNEAQARRLRAASRALPAGTWRLQQSAGHAPRWMVYVDHLEDELAVVARRAELRAQGLDVDRAGPGFEPGLSLGRYSSREAADRALQMLRAEAGVDDARVVQERDEEATYVLRAESTEPDWLDRLQTLPLAGQALHPCP